MPKLQQWLLEQLARYFIIIVSGFLLFISLSGEVVGYKIVYMLFFLFSGIVFQLSWNVWHRILRVFWLVLVVYSILVVVLTYTYQLNSFIDYWKTITGLDKEQLASLGLKKYEGSELMLKIFMPTAFLVCCMLQLHYYHERFVVLTEVDRSMDDQADQRAPQSQESARELRERRRTHPSEPDDKYRRREIMYGWWRNMCELYEIVRRITWKLLEIHRWKICAVTVIMSAIYQPSACYLFPVIIWIIGLPFRSFDHFIYIVTLLWASMILLMSMIYQLDFVKDQIGYSIYGKDQAHFTNCSEKSDSFKNVSYSKQYEQIDVLLWFGFENIGNSDDGKSDYSFSYSVRGWLAIIITLLAERVIFRRSRYLENMNPETKMAPGAIFPHITRAHADTNVKECCQFFANYFFHKFGTEICFVSMVITVWQRQDFWGSFYAVALLILMMISFKSRRHLARIWKPYTILLACIWALQYVFVLGFPPVLCQDYQWQDIFRMFRDKDGNTDTDKLTRFIKFMFLPERPHFYSLESRDDVAKIAKRLIPDFFQLLLAACQCAVFDNEEKTEWIKNAGSNEDQPLDNVKHNPYPNFILAEPPTTLDRFKTFVFSMVYWVTFTVVLIAGTNRESAFCLGYLVAAFYFLYKGQEVITEMPSTLRKRWNLLLFFGGFVIVTKCCLQYIACVTQVDNQTITHIFSLKCERERRYTGIEGEPIGIEWDFATFVFLLIQRRIFQSYYFLYVRADLIVQMGLSSKGNQLFSFWIAQESKKREKQEHDDKLRVQETIERIKANLRRDLREPYDHFDALRVCDKTWFPNQTEEIYPAEHSTESSQINRTPVNQSRVSPDYETMDQSMPPSQTADQLHTGDTINKHDQSPKLPDGIRQFKTQFGNILFTGRLQNANQMQQEEEPEKQAPGPSGLPASTQQLREDPSVVLERAVSHQPEPVVRKQPSGRWNRNEHGRASTVSAPEEPTAGFMTPPRDGSQENYPTFEDGADDEDDNIISPPRPGCGECMVTLGVDLIKYFTRVLNTRTQAYRSIIIQLKKDRQSYTPGNIFVPDRSYCDKIKREALRQSLNPDKNRKKSFHDERHGHQRSRSDQCHIEEIVEDTTGSSENEFYEETAYSREQVKFVAPDDLDKGEHYVQRLLSAIWYFGQFQIENVCYILMLFNGMLNASLLSLPYLGFIFLWAMLSGWLKLTRIQEFNQVITTKRLSSSTAVETLLGDCHLLHDSGDFD